MSSCSAPVGMTCCTVGTTCCCTARTGVTCDVSGSPRSGGQHGQLAGLPQAQFHDTRHTFASVLLSGGVAVAAAAEHLGHSPAVLLSCYAHLVRTDHDRARAVVGAAFASRRVTAVSG
ncbi:MAG: tyrosine-type recombinase/integrase [Ilumatobacteraceae bacterium]